MFHIRKIVYFKERKKENGGTSPRAWPWNRVCHQLRLWRLQLSQLRPLDLIEYFSKGLLPQENVSFCGQCKWGLGLSLSFLGRFLPKKCHNSIICILKWPIQPEQKAPCAALQSRTYLAVRPGDHLK